MRKIRLLVKRLRCKHAWKVYAATYDTWGGETIHVVCTKCHTTQQGKRED